jgi:DNA-binding CsgD family transcriptional regulator
MRPAEETNARRDRVTQLTRQGHTAKHIANLLGVTPRTVTRDRAARGITQPQPTRVTETEFARAKAMLEDGASYEEVARTLHRSHTAFRHRFPGYTLSTAEASQRAVLGRQMAQLLKANHP